MRMAVAAGQASAVGSDDVAPATARAEHTDQRFRRRRGAALCDVDAVELVASVESAGGIGADKVGQDPGVRRAGYEEAGAALAEVVLHVARDDVAVERKGPTDQLSPAPPATKTPAKSGVHGALLTDSPMTLPVTSFSSPVIHTPVDLLPLMRFPSTRFRSPSILTPGPRLPLPSTTVPESVPMMVFDQDGHARSITPPSKLPGDDVAGPRSVDTVPIPTTPRPRKFESGEPAASRPIQQPSTRVPLPVRLMPSRGKPLMRSERTVTP